MLASIIFIFVDKSANIKTLTMNVSKRELIFTVGGKEMGVVF